MKVGDEVYLKEGNKKLKGIIYDYSGLQFGVAWAESIGGRYYESELILASEHEKESIKPADHTNASILMEIAKEAAINKEYWKEFQYYGSSSKFESIKEEYDLLYHVGLNNKVRRKPRTIRIGKYDVPEPMRIPPKDRSKYYFADLSQDCISELVWADTAFDNYWLEIGLIFETEEGAELMLKALKELLAGKQ